MSVQDERRSISEKLEDAEKLVADLRHKYDVICKLERQKTQALQTIAKGSRYAKEIAQQALGWPNKMDQQIELLIEENLKLKLKLEQIEQEKALHALEEALKKKPHGEQWPKLKTIKNGGWYLCGLCGQISVNEKNHVCNSPWINPITCKFGN